MPLDVASYSHLNERAQGPHHTRSYKQQRWDSDVESINTDSSGSTWSTSTADTSIIDLREPPAKEGHHSGGHAHGPHKQKYPPGGANGYKSKGVDTGGYHWSQTLLSQKAQNTTSTVRHKPSNPAVIPPGLPVPGVSRHYRHGYAPDYQDSWRVATPAPSTPALSVVPLQNNRRKVTVEDYDSDVDGFDVNGVRVEYSSEDGGNKHPVHIRSRHVDMHTYKQAAKGTRIIAGAKLNTAVTPGVTAPTANPISRSRSEETMGPVNHAWAYPVRTMSTPPNFNHHSCTCNCHHNPYRPSQNGDPNTSTAHAVRLPGPSFTMANQQTSIPRLPRQQQYSSFSTSYAMCVPEVPHPSRFRMPSGTDTENKVKSGVQSKPPTSNVQPPPRTPLRDLPQPSVQSNRGVNVRKYQRWIHPSQRRFQSVQVLKTKVPMSRASEAARKVEIDRSSRLKPLIACH